MLLPRRVRHILLGNFCEIIVYACVQVYSGGSVGGAALLNEGKADICVNWAGECQRCPSGSLEMLRGCRSGMYALEVPESAKVARPSAFATKVISVLRSHLLRCMRKRWSVGKGWKADMCISAGSHMQCGAATGVKGGMCTETGGFQTSG